MLVMRIEFHFKFVERNLNVVRSLEHRLIQSLILVYSSNLSTQRNPKCMIIRFIDRKKNLYKNVHFLILSLKLIITLFFIWTYLAIFTPSVILISTIESYL